MLFNGLKRFQKQLINQLINCFNGKLFPVDGDDEMLLLSRYRIDVTEGNRGKYLRLTDSSTVYSLHFEAIGEMNLWLTRLLQVYTCTCTHTCPSIIQQQRTINCLQLIKFNFNILITN